MVAMTCHFCPAPTSDVCEWPVNGYRLVRLGNITPGDQIRRFNEKRPARGPAVVESANERILAGGAGIYIELKIVTPTGRMKLASGFPELLVQSLCEMPCSLPCCELHHRDVGDVHYCRDHWGMGLL